MTCDDAVEPPIGIEPMTCSLRGSYVDEKNSTATTCRVNQRNSTGSA